MDFNSIMQAVSTVAFPIVMCVLEAWYIKYQGDEHTKRIAEFNKSLDENTNILTKLYERLDMDDNSGK